MSNFSHKNCGLEIRTFNITSRYESLISNNAVFVIFSQLYNQVVLRRYKPLWAKYSIVFPSTKKISQIILSSRFKLNQKKKLTKKYNKRKDALFFTRKRGLQTLEMNAFARGILGIVAYSEVSYDFPEKEDWTERREPTKIKAKPPRVHSPSGISPHSYATV